MLRRLLLAAPLLVILVLGVACTVASPTPAPDVTLPTATAEALSVASTSANAAPLLAPSTTTAPAFGLPDVASVVERVAPAVVSVLVEVEQRDAFGRRTQARSQGSGVIFDAQGHILTNNHVVEGATRVEVALANRQRVPVTIVGTDPSSDLAILRLEPAAVERLVSAPLGDSTAMRVGDWVIAIGNPLGFEGSVTVGVISAKDRRLELDQDTVLYDLLQTDAVINPGNSGGPLVNLRGEVIGINTAIIRGRLASGQEAEGIGFSISMSTAVPVAQQLITNGRVTRPRIGVFIEDVTPVVAAERGLSVDAGVLVTGLVAGGPAERAGVRVGDVIVSVDATNVSRTTELQRLFLTRYRPGQTVNLQVVRSAVQLTITVALEANPGS